MKKNKKIKMECRKCPVSNMFYRKKMLMAIEFTSQTCCSMVVESLVKEELPNHSSHVKIR